MSYFRNASLSWFIFKQLCREEILMLSFRLFDKFINQSLTLIIQIISMAYLLRLQFAITPEYGLFMFTGFIATAGFFEAWFTCFNLVDDYEGDKAITYYLTLPIPSWLLFSKMIFCIAFRAMCVSGICLPIGKLVLWNDFVNERISWIPFMFIFLLGNFFVGTFSIWLSTMIASRTQRENLWARFILPLWYFSGYQYAWITIYKVSTPIAYLLLLNPMTYMMEGTRATLMGQVGYINVLVCVGMLVVLTFVFAWHAFYRLKKRLDFV